MLNPDNATLEWCAKWIEDSLRSETNERTIEFGTNMAMTIRAVKTTSPDAATAMRDKCVERLKVLRQHATANCEFGKCEYDSAVDDAVTELSSLTLDQVKPGEM